MENISKELFDKFINLRNSGAMNMTDIERGRRILSCSEEEYETILWNFNKLLLKFYPNTRVRR